MDPGGITSFVAPCSVLKALVAACVSEPSTASDLLTAATPYDDRLASYVGDALARFAERNTPEQPANIRAGIRLAQLEKREQEIPPFRVLDDFTHDTSLSPVEAGLVIFNLRDKRITQVQNSYAPVQRADRSRIRRDGRPIQQLYHYTLPDEWRIF